MQLSFLFCVIITIFAIKWLYDDSITKGFGVNAIYETTFINKNKII